MKLGEMLLKAGVINELQLKTALAEQQRWGGKLGRILVDMSYLSEDMLMKALSKQLGLPRAELGNVQQVPGAVLQRVDRAFCERHLVVPCRYDHNDRSLMVAMADTNNLQVLDEPRARTRLKIIPALAGDKAIALGISTLFHSETLTDAPSEELKIMSNSGSTLVRKVSDIRPPPPAAQPPQPVAPPPAPPPPVMALPQPPVIPAGLPPEVREELERSNKRHAKAIRVLVELLVERGHITAEQFAAQVRARG